MPSQGTEGEAVALNNLAVLIYEYSHGNLKDINRALSLCLRATDIMQVRRCYRRRLFPLGQSCRVALHADWLV